MPLGNARDFGHDPNPLIPSDDENPWTDAEPQFQGNIRRIEDELDPENLGSDEDRGPELMGDDLDVHHEEFVDPFSDEASWELAQSDEPSAEDAAALLNYLAAMQAPYVVTPADLVALVETHIITIPEARNYLEAKGVIAG